MTYCSLEEAWGNDFKNQNEFNNNTNSNVSNINNIPSYGTELSVSNNITSNSKYVPYQVNLPENSKRNSIGDLNIKDDTDLNNMLDTLNDNDDDITHIDRERNIDYANNYYNSEDYMLYKKYLNLAEKFKEKLKKKYKDFKENDTDIIEELSFKDININTNDYNVKDIIIIISVGIFIIFALDIFVKIGMRIRD